MIADVAREPSKVDVDHYLSPDVWVNPCRMGGEPCFARTRVPIRTLFDHLRAGDGYGAFLDGYEGVTREQVVAVIDLASRRSFDGDHTGGEGR